MESLHLIKEYRSTTPPSQVINKDAFEDLIREIQIIVGEPITIIRWDEGYNYSTRSSRYEVALEDSGKGLREISYWRVSDFPGCYSMAIFYDVYVQPQWQHKGLGKLLNKLRIAMAALEGFGKAMCTWEQSNEPQRKILEQNGWNKIDEYVVLKTDWPNSMYTNAKDSIVCVSTINLRG